MWVSLKYAKRWVGNYWSQQCLDTCSELSSRSKSVSAPATYDSQLIPQKSSSCMKIKVSNKWVSLYCCVRLKGERFIFGFPMQNIGLRNKSTQDLPVWTFSRILATLLLYREQLSAFKTQSKFNYYCVCNHLSIKYRLEKLRKHQINYSKTSFEKNCFSAWASTLNMGLINKVDMVCLSPVGYGV